MATSRGAGSRTILGVVAIVVVFVVIGALSNNNRTASLYALDSTSPTGTKAWALTIEHFGSQVSAPDHFPVDADIAVLFLDTVPVDKDDAVRAWVAQGHTLVIASPESSLAPAAAAGAGPHVAGQQMLDRATCDVDALHDVGTLDRGTVGSFTDQFVVPDGASSCFGDGQGAFLVVEAVGTGRIVSMAGGAMFQNQHLGSADNAALTTALFAPHPGLRVAVLTDAAFANDGAPGDGTDPTSGLSRIIGLGVKLLALQLAVALIVYGFSRGRRLGRPVFEPQPVQIAGSELVTAVGSVLQRRHEPTHAAAILRRSLRREVCVRVGLPFDASPDLIAATIAAQSTLEVEDVLPTVTDHPVADDAALLVLAHQIDTVRKEVLHVPVA